MTGSSPVLHPDACSLWPSGALQVGLAVLTALLVQPAWGTVNWDAEVPDSASLTVRVRASDDPDDLGSFVAVESMGDALCKYIDTGARYLQYQIQMSTQNTDASPVLREIVVTQGDGLPADFDSDGAVGAGDLAILLSAWGPCAECVEDLDASGDVGPSDLAILLAAWGPCA